MSNKQEFTLGQMLSIVTDRLFCPIGELYDIVGFMHDRAAYTHQLVRLANEAKPYIVEQHPWLADISVDSVTPHNWEQKLQEFEKEYGKHHILYGITENDTIE